MDLSLYHVDAFTHQPFRGNPAAVCWLEDLRPDDWMQSVAMEMNLSETAFVMRRHDGFSLRWFTPKTEVDLCGHATLAAAHVLWEQKWADANAPIRFHTRSGVLECMREKDGWIRMDFPATPAEACDAPPGLLEALGVKSKRIGKSVFDYLVEVEDESTVRALKPDMRKLLSVPARGVIVTSRAKEFDFVSRFFAPLAGIDEDPVTGSAHCALAPWWGKRLKKKTLHAFQASARGGELRLKLAGKRVHISGQAVTVMRGTLV